MKTLLIIAVALGTVSAFAKSNYDCGNGKTVTVNKSWIRGVPTSIDGTKVRDLGELESGEALFGNARSAYEAGFGKDLVDEAFRESYRTTGEQETKAYSEGFFTDEDRAFLVIETRRSPWCWWDGCGPQVRYELYACKKR